MVADGKPADPDPEVPERARQRSFTARYKLEILAAYDAAEPGGKGAILRREDLYSSHIAEWRRACDAGALAALAQPRGRKQPDPRTRRSRASARRRTGWSRSWSRPDVGTLARRVGLSIPTTSQHLAKLRLAGIVSARREGLHTYYEGLHTYYTVEDPHVLA